MKMQDSHRSELVYETLLTGSGMWSKVIGRGKTLRLTDVEGGANVGMLMYNSLEKYERYNMPDTLKGQHIFFLSKPYCIHSDMGRLFCSITEDTCGWHDTVCGCSHQEAVDDKFGCKCFQEARNEWHRSAHECFLIELGKWGLGERDLVPNMNWFSKVVSDDAGNLSYVANNSKAGDYVELRFELDTLVVLNTCQHPLDTASIYSNKPVKLSVFRSEEVPDDDPCRVSRPENERAHINTVDYNSLRF